MSTFALEGVTTLTRGQFDVEFEREVGDEDLSGWWCIATAEFPCPAAGCDFVARHMTAAHRIVVWPERDDRVLLSMARDARNLGRDPQVVEYARSMGPCISYDRWRQLGGRVHGMVPKSDGWDETARRRL
jgi:hypothetical protein